MVGSLPCQAVASGVAQCVRISRQWLGRAAPRIERGTLLLEAVKRRKGLDQIREGIENASE